MGHIVLGSHTGDHLLQPGDEEDDDDDLFDKFFYFSSLFWPSPHLIGHKHNTIADYIERLNTKNQLKSFICREKLVKAKL